MSGLCRSAGGAVQQPSAHHLKPRLAPASGDHAARTHLRPVLDKVARHWHLQHVWRELQVDQQVVQLHAVQAAVELDLKRQR